MLNEPYVSKPQRRWQRERFNGQKQSLYILHVRMYVYAFVLKAPKSGQVDFNPDFVGSSSQDLQPLNSVSAFPRSQVGDEKNV